MPDTTSAPTPHRVVVVGSGFGGLFAAKALKRAPVEVTMVSDSAQHLFQPLLYQVATGILSQGEVAPPAREILRSQKNLDVLLGTVTDVDLGERQVTAVTGEHVTTLPYDSLIVATGARQSYFGHPEFEQFAPGIKNIDDALELRSRIFGAFEMAELLPPGPEQDSWMTFVVVGGGPTGVEMAGQLRELARRSLKRNFRHIDPTKARVLLVDGADEVLATFGHKQADYTRRKLESLGVQVELGQMVVGVDDNGATLRSKDGTETRIDSRFIFWAAGVEASPLAKMLGEASGADVDRAGRVCTEPDLTLPGHPEVFVVGDMASLNNYPGVAQVAMQGGKYAAKTIKGRLADKPALEPFKYFDKGSMATISRFSAVANVGSLTVRGFLAWLMWLFIHIVYLVGFFQRISTFGHWIVAFIGRTRTERTFTTYQSRGAIGEAPPTLMPDGHAQPLAPQPTGESAPAAATASELG